MRFLLPLILAGGAVFASSPPATATGVEPPSLASDEAPERVTVDEEAELLASDGGNWDFFGEAVAVSGDVLVVSSRRDDDNGFNAGAAYVFEKPPAGWSGTVHEVAKLLASDSVQEDAFARDVSISGDVVLVGAVGAVYVFVEPAGGWSGTLTETARLVASDSVLTGAVSISGDTVVAGSAEDDVSGANSGSAYVFIEPAGGWSGTLGEDAKLVASDGGPFHRFGRSVSVSGDTVLVTAPRVGDGTAYVFERPPGGWSGILEENAQLKPSEFDSEESFAVSSASISGGVAVVGAHTDPANGFEAGSAYVFEKPAGGWAGTVHESTKLLPSDGRPNSWFGDAVAVSGDLVAIGAQADDGLALNLGSAYVFKEPPGGWSGPRVELGRLLPSDGAANDRFGTGIAVAGEVVAVGAYQHDDNGAGSGSAYVFTPPSAAIFADGFESGDTGAWVPPIP